MQQSPRKQPTVTGRSAGHEQWRRGKDAMARYLVGGGGVIVIAAIVLIFFYLAWVVLPVFEAARLEPVAEYRLTDDHQQTLYLAMEEQAEIAARFTAAGEVEFIRLRDGAPAARYRAGVPDSVSITAFAVGEPLESRVAYGLSDGRALVLKHHYEVSFPDDVRVISPEVRYPLGRAPLLVDDRRQALRQLAIQDGADEATLVAATADGRVVLAGFVKEASLLEDEVILERSSVTLPALAHPVDFILLDKTQDNLYLVGRNGELSHFSVTDKTAPRLIASQRVAESGREITQVVFLTGDLSLLVGDSSGAIIQWSLLRGENNISRLVHYREFQGFDSAIVRIVPEYNRKGFLAMDLGGRLGIFHTTSNRRLLLEAVLKGSVSQLAVAPRANAMLALDGAGEYLFRRVYNEHPEVSWQAIWGEIWYESYPEPDYVWQSSSASDDFEPKFSLVPITFGTLKAAFYAMLIAVPLSLMGAIYTAHFMTPRMRGLVKPGIEIMEALPTVILGFLAGLWLAPFVERHLPGILMMLLVLPVGMLLTSYAWQHVPAHIRHRVPEGWEAVLLLPIVILIVWSSLFISPAIEQAWFDGDMRLWLTHEMGIGFDQRNAIVVGLTMGFAIIPTIFSIAEDAIFGVPKHLVHGSLALGATPWQTLIRVVLLTASPGIFSAVMIGLGRAVGETMIVLMATGNTPVMNFSPFEGLRTLSANIAVELPESEVNSTHYRVLFMAALVLLMFTFILNSLAEVIRHRLRRKYSTL